MKIVNLIMGFSLVCLMTNIMVIRGVPYIFGARDPLWDDYAETQEWHEIGGMDPRYQDGCGPGVHEGNLGEPGCH